MARVGCYTLDLYCGTDFQRESHDEKQPAYHHEFPHNFTGRTYSDCVRQAKRMGWKLAPGTAQGNTLDLCPKCNEKVRRR